MYILQITKRRIGPVFVFNVQIPDQVECLAVFACYIPRMDVMLDFICMGPVDLSEARRKRQNTKCNLKILVHSWTRTHNPEISSLAGLVECFPFK